MSISQRLFLLPWLGSALFFALAALHARPATVRNRTVRPLVRSMVVYTPVLIAYLIGFYQLVWGTLSVLEMTALVVTGILASGNHVAIFVENARLTQSLRTNLRTLAESERRFRLVLDELAEGVAVAGADGTVRSISARITDLLGWRPAQLVGRSIFEFVHPDDLASVRAGFDAAIGGGIGNPIMLRVLKTDGTYAPVEAEAGSYIEETAMSGLVISVRDLTLRLRQEALLREAEQRFRVAFEEAPIGILLATTGGHLIQVNAAFGSMLGLPTDQVEGRHLSELGPDQRAGRPRRGARAAGRRAGRDDPAAPLPLPARQRRHRGRRHQHLGHRAARRAPLPDRPGAGRDPGERHRRAPRVLGPPRRADRPPQPRRRSWSACRRPSSAARPARPSASSSSTSTASR